MNGQGLVTVGRTLRGAGDIRVTPNRPPLIGLVPARGGSKGIKGKNLQPVCGQPLVVHAIRLCLGVCDRVIVSTDDPAIAAIAGFAGAEVVGRPDELASDIATVDEVCEWLQTIIDVEARLLVVQPTVPQVRPSDLHALIEQFDGDAWVCGVESAHILWQGGIPVTGRANRQEPLTWPIREIGVRIYAPGHWGNHPDWVFPFRGPVVDIDTPADLAAVRSDMERRTVCFRTIGNREKGSGHLHRCLALAERLQHHQVGFIPVQSDGLVEALVRKHGWPVWSQPGGADLIINDVLDTSPQQMARLVGVAPVVALEDLGDGADLASFVVNDLYGWTDGPKLAIVRPEFLAVPDSEFRGGRVLVTFGGTDPAGLTERIAPLLGGTDMRVVAPPGRDGVWRNLAEDMAWCDLVVTSGGRTVWEATAARRPCVTILQNAREATHRHLSLGAGVVNLGLAGLVSVETSAGTVRRLAASPVTLSDLSSRMVGVVDGRGADRIVAECERIMGGL